MNDSNPGPSPAAPQALAPAGTEEKGLRTIAQICYGLLALGFSVTFLDLTSFRPLARLFLYEGFPYVWLIAIVITEAKRKDSKPYWYANHYRWMRTTGYMLTSSLILLIWSDKHAADTHFAMYGIVLACGFLFWGAIRTIKGWLLLIQGKAIPKLPA